MLYKYSASLDFFSYCIFSDLDMSKAFSGKRVGPRYASCVIVVYCCWTWHYFVSKTEFIKDIS